MNRPRYMDEENVVPFLDLEELEKEEKNPHRVKMKVFKMILAKCHDKIRRTNKTTLVIIGYPGYELDEVNYYLVNQLKQNGLTVKRISPQNIFISWRPNRVDYEQYHRQADKLVAKPNIYKVSVSPLADDPGVTMPPGSKHPHVRKKHVEEEPSPVALLQYDQQFDDMVPVNSKRVNDEQAPPNLHDEPRRRSRASIINPAGSNYKAPTYAHRYNKPTLEPNRY
jgi:hypothetical protein